jgi:hypothetical protein
MRQLGYTCRWCEPTSRASCPETCRTHCGCGDVDAVGIHPGKHEFRTEELFSRVNPVGAIGSDCSEVREREAFVTTNVASVG